MYFLSDFTPEELRSVKSYIGNYQQNSYVKDVKAVWHNNYRQENQWNGIALSFEDNLKQDDFIEQVVKLHADEYWGISELNGKVYHVFWYD